MSSIIEKAKAEIGSCKTTGDIRKFSAALYKTIKDKSIHNVFSFCDELLELRKWEFGVIAFDFAYRVKKQYDIGTFDKFETWLKKYVRGWGDCDDFCTHAFGELIIQYPQLFSKVKEWTACTDFWMRRASAVVLIPAVKKDVCQSDTVFEISDTLIEDEHDLVRKGYGWMLKVLAVKEPEKVIQYLIKNHDVMPRVSFRYAIEKLENTKKIYLMNL